uniref:Uncharacterized protein n=1 Tax=Myoviridae sp. ctNnv6 TaxID=2825091 RepID=A0A8S5P3L4_9CAUD|nr:MAG TPA: hypothetical protein [Myoviridae sp. ctNnv6]
MSVIFQSLISRDLAKIRSKIIEGYIKRGASGW